MIDIGVIILASIYSYRYRRWGGVEKYRTGTVSLFWIATYSDIFEPIKPISQFSHNENLQLYFPKNNPGNVAANNILIKTYHYTQV